MIFQHRARPPVCPDWDLNDGGGFIANTTDTLATVEDVNAALQELLGTKCDRKSKS